MRWIRWVVCFLFSGALSLYAQKELELQSVKRTRYQITSVYDSGLNPKTVKIISDYKSKIDKQMNEVIGFSPEAILGGRYDSPLLQLTTKVIHEQCETLTGVNIHLSFMNDGGLRNSLRKGEVTVGNIFEIYPFDNTLVVLSVKGKELKKTFDFIAKDKGIGVHGATFTVVDSKIQNLRIANDTLVDERVYNVGTIDYLAEGNDGMSSFSKIKKRVNTHVLLRDAMLMYVRECSKLGKKID